MGLGSLVGMMGVVMVGAMGSELVMDGGLMGGVDW